jgi:hypothetical protein
VWINFLNGTGVTHTKKEIFMLKKRFVNYCYLIIATIGVAMLLSQSAAFAAVPVVKTVPWVASNPLIPHDTWSGKSIRLKGTSDLQGANIKYSWSFGDGSADTAFAAVADRYALEASHTYTGAVGTIYTATLTVQDTGSAAPNTGTANYFVVIQDKSLSVEVNVAIDEGLWYLHKNMSRSGNYGYWGGYNAVTPTNLNAFFVNGHLETGSVSNPYTETVQRGMIRLFNLLTVSNIGVNATQTYPAPIGTVVVDSNGNGLAIHGGETYTYSTGLYMDAIVASGTPDAVTTSGPANVIGRKYRDIVQDMVDGYAYGQTDAGTWMGGWGYTWNNGNSDNSVNQWAVIGMLAADGWGKNIPNPGDPGVKVPAFVKAANKNSLNNTNATTANCGASNDGAFAYTNEYCYFPWGPYGTTPAGMVQMVFDGISRGNSQWDRTENFIRNNFCNTGNSNQAIREYYYGLFSFTKSMLLSPGGGIQFLKNQPSGANPIDWYAAETSTGAACNGVARKLVGDQLAAGNWGLHNYNGYHTDFSSAWAIIMLNRTVFASGVPVAVITAFPNPAVAGQTINLSGASSYGQGGNAIVLWEWDLDNNGSFETTGLTAAKSYPAVGSYPVNLRVTDSASQTATTTKMLNVNTPPLAPSANAGGPYNFCKDPVGVSIRKWFLDGTGSVNPDNGQHEPGAPGDFIKEYAWELTGDNAFNDKTGATPDVTNFWGVGAYNIQLRVKDNTLLSFPSSGQQDLTSVASTQVVVRASTDPACSCVINLAARAKPTKADLTWTWRASAHHYNVYRGTSDGGPYAKIGVVTVPGLVNTGVYADSGLVNGTTYYYVVREAAANDSELCQSNQASAKPLAR